MWREAPPQSIGQALDLGWTALAFTCPRRSCGHEGRVDMDALPRRQPLASVFARCVCGRCGSRPSSAFLAVQVSPDTWRRKELDLIDG